MMATIAKRTIKRSVTVEEVIKLIEDKIQSDVTFATEFKGEVEKYAYLVAMIINNFSSCEDFFDAWDEYHTTKRGETYE